MSDDIDALVQRLRNPRQRWQIKVTADAADALARLKKERDNRQSWTMETCQCCSNQFVVRPFKCTTCSAAELENNTLLYERSRATKAEKELDAIWEALEPDLRDTQDGNEHALVDQVVRLKKERDEAEAQATAHEAKWQTLCQRTRGTCACSYDNKDDVCAYHSPMLAAAEARAARLENALGRARTVLGNMALENEGAIFQRWPIHHEPLRGDAKRLLPIIDEALAALTEPEQPPPSR